MTGGQSVRTPLDSLSGHPDRHTLLYRSVLSVSVRLPWTVETT